VAELVRAAGDLPFQVQDEAAQLVSLLAAGELAGRGGRVLDACAAPGGKAFHLAELLAPGSEIVAIELHPRKAEELAREAARRSLAGVRVICADATRPVPGLDPGSFDAVLVDAPCAGLGTLRRHPELKLRRTAADLDRMAELQAAVLEHRALRAAGRARDLLHLLALPRRRAAGRRGRAPRRPRARQERCGASGRAHAGRRSPHRAAPPRHRRVLRRAARTVTRR
jgi:16S rRNA (cytosine967-C5)-methyltransferase